MGCAGRRILALACAALCACDAEAPAPEAVARTDPSVVARVDGVPITEEELDAPLRIALHELDVARHALRAERLEAMIEMRVGGADAHDPARVERHLRAPQSPRLTLDAEGAVIRGRADAPVTIVLFVDYEAPQARRLQPVLARILEAYPDDVRLALRDLPQPFHRNAREAARAAHCAGLQDAYWSMYDAMLLESVPLARDVLRSAARRAGVDVGRLLDCVDSRRHEARIDADLALAARIGVGMGPALFVEGLFVSARVDYEGLAAVIDRELGRSRPRIQPSTFDPPPDLGAALPSSLTWSLDFVIPARGEARAQAVIRTREGAAPTYFGVGDAIEEGFVVVAIEPTRAYLQRGEGAIEYLALAERPDPLPPGPLPRLPESVFPEPQSVVTLDRDRVSAALADRQTLESRLGATRGTYSGRRLLIIEAVEPGDLYDLLGLHVGDVLMAVDREWLTDQHNPLWQVAGTRDDITLVFMRRGTPQSRRYRIR